MSLREPQEACRLWQPTSLESGLLCQSRTSTRRFELQGFQHLFRHKYGFDLKPDRVVANLDTMKSAFPAFVDAVVCLEGLMKNDADHEVGSSAIPGTGR